MNNSGRLLPFCVLITAWLVFFSAKATTLDELLANDQLSLSIRLQTAGKILAKQAVVLEVEISTQHWFAKGTKLDSIQMANTVILPTNQFAINSTKRIKGKIWASQIREITLYPLQKGKYNIPPIGIFISINAGASGIIEGKLFTPPLSFTAKMLATLTQVDSFTVSTDFQLNIKDDFTNDRTYNIGEAVSQTVTFSADDVPAMMLPSYIKPTLDGVSIYHKPVQLHDKASRGTLTGVRTQSFTYIFEQAGEYIIPEQIFYWWNLTTKTLSSERVPSQRWLVTGEKEQGNHLENKRKWSEIGLLSIITFGVVLLFILFFLLYIKHSSKLKAINNSHSKNNDKNHYQVYIKAIKQKQYRTACTHLYKIYDIKTNQYRALHHYFTQQKEKLNLLNKLFQLAYQNSNSAFTLDEAKSLLPSKKNKSLHLKEDMEKYIKLNT